MSDGEGKEVGAKNWDLFFLITIPSTRFSVCAWCLTDILSGCHPLQSTCRGAKLLAD